MRTVAQNTEGIVSWPTELTCFTIWPFVRKHLHTPDQVARRGLPVEEMFKLRTEWQGGVSHGEMQGEKIPVQRSQGGNGIDIFQEDKEANVAEGRQWKSSEINWRVWWGATQFKPACMNRGNSI